MEKIPKNHLILLEKEMRSLEKILVVKTAEKKNLSCKQVKCSRLRMISVLWWEMVWLRRNWYQSGSGQLQWSCSHSFSGWESLC